MVTADQYAEGTAAPEGPEGRVLTSQGSGKLRPLIQT